MILTRNRKTYKHSYYVELGLWLVVRTLRGISAHGKPAFIRLQVEAAEDWKTSKLIIIITIYNIN